MAVRKVFTTTKRAGSGTDDSATATSVSAMTAVDDTILTGDEFCIIMEDDDSGFYAYKFNRTGTAATNAPDTYRPNNYSINGNWEMQPSPFGEFGPYVSSVVPLKGDIRGGDITVSGSTLTITPCSCKGSTGSIRLYTSENKTLILPSGAGTESDSWLIAMVRLVADSSIAFQYYTDQAAIDADNTVNAHRKIDWWQNNSAGTAAKAGYSKNGIHWNLKASESAVNSLGTVPANCSTAIDCAAFLPPADMVDSVLPGVQGNGTAQVVGVGVDGTNAVCSDTSTTSNLGDTDIYAWGRYGTSKFIPLKNSSNIYWGRGSEAAAGTHKLLIQAVRLRR